MSLQVTAIHRLSDGLIQRLSSFCLRRYLSHAVRTSITTDYRAPSNRRILPISGTLISRQRIQYFASDASSTKNSNQANEPAQPRVIIDSETRRKLTMADGLNPDEWTLIYLNPIGDRLWFKIIPIVTLGSILAVLLGVFICCQVLALAYVNQMRQEILSNVTGAFTFGFCTFGFLNRWRRLAVFRMYQRHVKKGGQANDEKREYCIIWYNFWRGRRQYFYNSTETSGARETLPVRNVQGPVMPRPTFYARKRAWFVHPTWFFNPDDYFHARMPDFAQNKK